MRLRRDLRTCCEQHEKALACGDRPLVKVSILGKVVKMQNRFFALCSFCASIVQVSQLKRFHGDICCGRCDLSMISETPPGASTAAARVAVRYEVSSSRPAPAPFASVALASKLRCRFCNKHPPNSLTASNFASWRPSIPLAETPAFTTASDDCTLPVARVHGSKKPSSCYPCM